MMQLRSFLPFHILIHYEPVLPPNFSKYGLSLRCVITQVLPDFEVFFSLSNGNDSKSNVHSKILEIFLHRVFVTQ